MCCIYENTNFESNSQHINKRFIHRISCVVSTKIQILKAIHNYAIDKPILVIVVLYLRKYKFWKQFTTLPIYWFIPKLLCCIYENTNFESNSQRYTIFADKFAGCVVSTKIQILKAIHNLFPLQLSFERVVLYLRKYKFWKQFTTRIE